MAKSYISISKYHENSLDLISYFTYHRIMDGEFEVVNNQEKFLKQIVCSTVSGDGPATLYDRTLQATMTSSNGNIFPRYWTFVREFTGHR